MNKPQPLPYLRSYWFLPGKLLGGFYPGSSEPKGCRKKLELLHACGIRSMVNLMEADEVDNSGRVFLDYEPLLPDGMRFKRFAIQDRYIPTAELMDSILRHIHSEIKQGYPVYLHCRGGVGRTGTVMACYLKRYHPEIEDVFAWINEKRRSQRDPKAEIWLSPDTDVQRQFVAGFQP